MPSSKVSKAGCSSGVYSWRRSLERATAILSKPLWNQASYKFCQTPAGTAFKFDSRNCSSAWEAAYPQDHQEPIRLKQATRLGKAQIYLTSQAFKAKSRKSSPGIHHDFDYSDLVTSSYFLGTHMNSLTSSLDNNMKLYQAQKAIIPRPNRS